jgi:cytoplasmic iron level regulating protein YaaA (DUF328/UPF0246 family)
MKILLHSSKTMKPETSSVHRLTTPQFIDQASYLNEVLRGIDKVQLATLMGISQKKAASVDQQIDNWRESKMGTPAALTFRGDIYSGLSAALWDKSDAGFAQKNLLILSGLYGLLRPFDEIMPYRLEMGYRLKLDESLNLDKFWEKEMADILDANDSYINLTSKEYFKVVNKRLSKAEIISPKFLSVSEKTNEPVFVTVHAKIARGSFANWLIKNKVEDIKKITGYNDLNYSYEEALSDEYQPVFICRKFGGLGLSVRLK